MFSAEMPDEPSHVIAPLDGDTAERLLSGRLDPDDAPPGYAEVARLLRAAAAPADESELTGQAAAMNAFRARPRRVEPPGRPARPPTPGGVRGRRGGVRGRVPGGRGRLVALALAGVVAAAGLGVWTAGGTPFSGELGSPSGGPGSETPGSGVNGAGAGAAGSLRPLWPGLSSGAGTARVADGRPPALPTPSERAAARHGGGVTARGGGPAHGSKPTGPDKQTRPSSKPPKSPKPKAPEPKSPEPNSPEPKASEPKAPEPKATNGHASKPKGAKG